MKSVQGPSLSSFDEASFRLKQELRVKTDKAAAAMLGLSQVAWVGRKKRGSFPETELLALKGRRPDLSLDVGYVLTGERMTGHVREQVDRMVAFTPSGNEELTGLAIDAIKRMARLQGDRAPIYANFLERLNYCSEEQIDLLSLLVDQLVRVGSRVGRGVPTTGSGGATQTFHGKVGTAIHGDHATVRSVKQMKPRGKP